VIDPRPGQLAAPALEEPALAVGDGEVECRYW
jgi:hypothetical protein